MHRESFPNYLIISGSGRNVGKTFLGMELIRSFSAKFPLLALKISPHTHDVAGNTKLRAGSGGFRIFQDLEPHPKNSGRFLAAGAIESFFMETGDRHLAEGFECFLKECNPAGRPVICESGALGNLIKPGLLIFITRPETAVPENKVITSRLADMVLPALSFSAPETAGKIGFSENCWYRLSP